MRPIVIEDGRLRQLKDTDTLSGITQTKTLNFFGTLEPTYGTARWYPDKPITILNVLATIGVVSSDDIQINIKKNGSNILGSYLTLPSNQHKSEPVVIGVQLTTDDFITMDIISATGGSNLNITLVYS
jgi:hypothetical protein